MAEIERRGFQPSLRSFTPGEELRYFGCSHAHFAPTTNSKQQATKTCWPPGEIDLLGEMDFESTRHSGPYGEPVITEIDLLSTKLDSRPPFSVHKTSMAPPEACLSRDGRPSLCIYSTAVLLGCFALCRRCAGPALHIGRRRERQKEAEQE